MLTEFGSPGAVVVLAFTAALLMWWRFSSAVWTVACVLAPTLAGVSEATLKVLVARRCPVSAALTGEGGNGFPSGHAAGFTALVFIVVIALVVLTGREGGRRYGVFVASVASAAMAVTRVVVGAHYPTDVMGGTLLGYVLARIVADLALHPSAAQRFTSWRRFLQTRTGRVSLKLAEPVPSPNSDLALTKHAVQND